MSMARFTLLYDAATGEALVQPYGTAESGDYEDVGDFYEGNVADAGGDDNRVLYQHVQNLLGLAGEQNMQRVRITFNKVTAISSAPATVTLAAAATQQITNTFTPTNASNKAVTYASSDVTKATVSASGLITAVAVGEATITATTEDGGFTDTVVVTVE